MSVTLTPQAETTIQEWIDAGGFPDAAAVIEKALQALEEQERAKFLRTRELVRAGFESPGGRELTDEVWEEMERAVDEAYLRGDEPPPHVRP